MIEAELLINVASRQAREVCDDVIELCAKHGIRLTKITRLSNPKRLHSVLSQIVERKPKLLIVGSGDGTVSDVVDQLADTDIQLGIIPLGTTNNFARSLGLPMRLEPAIERIVEASPKRIDLGMINDDYFANVAGFGLSADVAATIPNSLKKRWGRLAYAIQGIKRLIHHKPFVATISSKSNKLSLNIKTHQLIVANGSYHAGTEIASDATVDNKQLVVFKLGGPSRLSLVWHMIDFYVGKRSAVANTAFLIAKDIHITTSRPVRIELDGEVKEKTPARVRVRGSVLRVRY
jgi:YegS/Rv2252/BmrU family lipid kinase